MDLKVIRKIRQVVRCFETGRTVGADYAAIAIMNDGPNQMAQITYGASQTTEYGNLKVLIKMYVDAKGIYADELKVFLDRIGRAPSLCTDKEFLKLLKDAGTNDPIMHNIQDEFFRLYYFEPALNWAIVNGFTKPLSILVIYDSFVHSGGIMAFLRNSFPEKTPAKGGKEKEWITSYVIARDKWLENHSVKLLQNTDYRTDSFIYAIRENNWDLVQPFKVVNYPDKDEKQIPQIRAEIV